MQLTLTNPAETKRFAADFGTCLPEIGAGWVVLLAGELGTGKSTFARALIHSLGYPGPVPSPTYTLIEPYEVRGGRVYHLDLYRIAEEDELFFLGYAELDDGLRLIEWPERAPGVTMVADIRLTFHYLGPGRKVQVEGLSARGREAVRCLETTRSARDRG